MEHEYKLLHPSIPPRSHSLTSLAYGQFYGIFERRHELPGFSVAFIGANEAALGGVKHAHESAHFIFILAGRYVSPVPGPERAAPLRSLIFVPTGTTHSDRFQTRQTRTLTVSVSAARMKEACAHIRLPEAQSHFAHGEIPFLAGRLEVECRLWQDTSALTAEGLCLELLAAVAKRNEMRERQPPRWLRTARELLHDRCREPVSISEIAAVAGVHPIHLSRTFRKFFNCTPGEYLRDCRLEMSASLLSSQRIPIAQVALECGFTDQSQLSKAFRRKFGVTPAEFRRNSRHV
jgi:AraC family transcriptional regulator